MERNRTAKDLLCFRFLVSIKTGDENGFFPFSIHSLNDACDLFRSFPGTVNHLRRTFTDSAMKVDFGISDILIRRLSQQVLRLGRTYRPVCDTFKQFFKCISVHR